MRKVVIVLLSLIGVALIALGVKVGMLTVIRGFAGQI